MKAQMKYINIIEPSCLCTYFLYSSNLAPPIAGTNMPDITKNRGMWKEYKNFSNAEPVDT